MISCRRNIRKTSPAKDDAKMNTFQQFIVHVYFQTLKEKYPIL